MADLLKRERFFGGATGSLVPLSPGRSAIVVWVGRLSYKEACMRGDVGRRDVNFGEGASDDIVTVPNLSQ
jgi:hypothetical protein